MKQEKIKFTELQMYANDFIRMMDEHEGELNDDSQELIDKVEKKIDTGFFVVDKLTSEIKDIDGMIKELQHRKKQKQQQLEFISGVVIRSCEVLNIEKRESFKLFKIQKKPPRVDILQPELIDKRFTKTVVKESTTISKTLIKQAIEAGEQVVGAKLVNDEKKIAIKAVK